MHFSEIIENELEIYNKIILCGTALKDNSYAKNLKLFSWIKPCKAPVLGICAGMQVIGAIFGGKIQPQPTIGLEKIEIITNSHLLGEPRMIEGYHLHNFGVTMPEGFLLIAGSPNAAIAFQHGQRPLYGIIFHPEVRNRWILEKFANL
jgi:GMP synthase-like glutamine amidotransferase